MQWIARTATNIRYLRAAGSVAAQRTYILPSRLRWDRSALLRRSVTGSIQAINIAAFIVVVNDSIKVHAASDASAPVEEERTSAGKIEDDVEEPVDIDYRSDRPFLVELVHYLKDSTDRSTKALLCSLVAANVSVTTAFRVAFNLNKQPKPKPGLLRFLSRNFVLSQGWVSRGRWHVILTCMFAHLETSHLVRNMLATTIGVLGCSRFLSASEIAELFLAGGIIGGTFSILVSRALRKHRYIGEVTGGSDAANALVFFFVCAEDVPRSATSQWLYLFKAIVFGGLIREAVGFRRYLRYGLRGTGPNVVNMDHGAHLAGAATGLAAYALKYGCSPIFSGLWRKDDVDTAVSSKE